MQKRIKCNANGMMTKIEKVGIIYKGNVFVV